MNSIKMKLILVIVLLCVVAGGVLVAAMNMAYQRNMALFTEYANNPDAGEQTVKDELFEAAAANRNRAMGMAVGLAVLQAVVLVIALNSFVFKRIDQVIHDTTRFIGGEFAAPIPVRGGDEMGKLEGALEEFRVLLHDTMEQVPDRN